MATEETNEKYFNIYAAIPFACAIAAVIHDVEPQATAFKIAVGAVFGVIWTSLVGLAALLFVVMPLVTTFSKGSELEKTLYKYFVWWPPLLGFCVFLYVNYN